MSKLDKLIQELCTDGVEYVKLSEIATIVRGGNFQKKDFIEQGIPCIHYGQIYTKYGLFAKETFSFISEEKSEKQKFAETNDIIMAVTSENIDDVCKSVAWLGETPVAVSGHTAIIHHNQNPKYMCYYFHSTHFKVQKNRLAHGTKVMEVTPSKLNNITIPIPPLPVQREIVRILDTFTELTTELNEKLTTELTARKKQYEYYRDKLLTFDGNVPIVKLGGVEYVKLSEIVTIARGGNFQKKDFIEQGIPCIHYGQIYTKYGLFAKETFSFISEEKSKKQKFAETNDIIMAVTSENIDDVCKSVAWLGETPVAVSGHTAIIHHNQNPKYMCYYFHSTHFKMQKNRLAHGAKVMEVTPSKLNNITIPVPPLAEQARIVAILDRFDTLCNDLSAGLPAEIEARKKQYEYYRDKLLDFKPKNASERKTP